MGFKNVPSTQQRRIEWCITWPYQKYLPLLYQQYYYLVSNSQRTQGKYQNSYGSLKNRWTIMFTKKDIIIPNRGQLPWTPYISPKHWGLCWKDQKYPQLEIPMVSQGSMCVSGFGAIYCVFLLKLTEFTNVLMLLTTKACDSFHLGHPNMRLPLLQSETLSPWLTMGIQEIKDQCMSQFWKILGNCPAGYFWISPNECTTTEIPYPWTGITVNKSGTC